MQHMTDQAAVPPTPPFDAWAEDLASARENCGFDNYIALIEDALRKAYRLGGSPPLPPQMELRRMDTPENRAFWASVTQAREEWERSKPDWARDLEHRQAEGSPPSPPGNTK